MALAKHHLGLGDRDICIVANSRQWMRGSFNVCIPVEVQSPSSCWKLALRCAMPYKLAESENPGSVDEKMGCEVRAYAWMQEKCPDIRIPHLYGFGSSDHRHFTHEAHHPLYVRFARYLWRLLRSLPPKHSPSTNALSLARIPQPRIGSFRFHDNGTITLTNRPLTCSIIVLENDGTPRTIPRNNTYPSTEPFIADLFTFHDKRFLSHPNAIFDEKDCHSEMAAKAMLRALAHRYVPQDQWNGPFFLQLDDLHASNIFIDDDWNVTCFIDLEWVCALPVENLSIREEFMNIFEEEERKVVAEHGFSLAQIMRETWESGGMWFWLSIMTTNAMYYLFTYHICPRISSPVFKEEEFLSKFWSEDAAKVVKTKIEEYHVYETELKQIFSVERGSDN
ncbi:hypothetical protein B0O99DRAFT_653521 [Bisporella sp. PMI_857]|nr:hypothetical protein B0O99DRAFT_653521 [Bisporella sp. PMI_857]